MEFRDGLKQGVGREISQQALESTKGQGALIKVLVAFRGVQAEAGDEPVGPPILTGLVQVAVLAVLGGQEVQGVVGIGIFFPEEGGDGHDVLHQPHRILKHIVVDLLQNVFVSCVGGELQGHIDVAVAEGLTGDRGAFQAEGKGGFFHFHRDHLILIFPAVFCRFSYHFTRILPWAQGKCNRNCVSETMGNLSVSTQKGKPPAKRLQAAFGKISIFSSGG